MRRNIYLHVIATTAQAVLAPTVPTPWLFRRWEAPNCLAVLISAAVLGWSPVALAGAVRSGFDSNVIATDPNGADADTSPTGEDGSVGPVDLGFGARFCNPGDPTFTSVYININGNLTFGEGFPSSRQTPPSSELENASSRRSGQISIRAPVPRAK